MTKATPEQLELAYQICNRDEIYSGITKRDAAFRAALAAIIETTERAADYFIYMDSDKGLWSANALRNQEHLK